MKNNVLSNLLRVTLPIVLIIVAIAYFAWEPYISDRVIEGRSINQHAWEASYSERNLLIPLGGPREGYWGSRIGKKIRHPELGWKEPALNFPDVLVVDSNGHQHYRKQDEKLRILIFGGSVAFGANASNISKTYFNVIGGTLDQQSPGVSITVIAAGAWKSSQEVKATALYIERYQPDWVIYLNGLNDLTNGATAKSLFGERTNTREGVEWTYDYHSHDYQARVVEYLNNMRMASKLNKSSGSKMLVVLQPALFEKYYMSEIEKTLLRRSLVPHVSVSKLIASYEAIRHGLKTLAKTGDVFFVDASRGFDSERETTFVDMWHFSDIGHQLLGTVIAENMITLINHDLIK